MLRITNFSVPFDEERSLEDLAAKRLQLPPEAVRQVVIVRKAVDARRYKNSPIHFVYMLDVEIAGSEKRVLARLKRDKNVAAWSPRQEEALPKGSEPLMNRPVVIGFGPAGMLAAWQLAKEGYRPLVLERGRSVDERAADIAHFWQSGRLNVESNVQFGEGGAGTFSDGKLTTRVNDARMQDIIDLFIECGAPAEIKYLHKPHIGTDILRKVVKRLREKIIMLGGTVRFEAKVTDMLIKDGQLQELVVNDSERIACSVVLAGIGHSARDTYELFYEKGAAMEAKPFAVGVRIEHPQEWIDRAQYGVDAGNPLLPTADYALTYQDTQTGRGVYSFCMCPGGTVVAAASEQGGVVTNGMSNHARDTGIANSALLVTVTPEDFGGGVLGGISFQRHYERLAFEAGGGDYRAPAQTVGDFLGGYAKSSDTIVVPSYQPGVKMTNLNACLPLPVAQALKNALPEFARKIKGFAHPGVVMTGIESRSSAPCRILRGRDSYESLNIKGLYPIGEGAGYAGGIMSAAADGLRAAQMVISRYRI